MTLTIWTDILDTVTGDINRLSSVWRYSSIPVVSKENVSEHLGWVCLYSLLIHNHLRPTDHALIGPIASHAISHDCLEAVTGDVVRTFKYSSPELKKAINDAEEIILKQLPQPVQVIINSHHIQLSVLNRIDELDYVECVVKAADFMSLWMYMRREVYRSNKEIYPFFCRMIQDLMMMSKKYEVAKAPLNQLSTLYYSMAERAQELRSSADVK